MKVGALLAAALIACEKSPPEATPEATPEAEAPPEAAAPTPLSDAQRHFAAVPDSVLMRRGACPFECCVYGEWRAETPIAVRPAARGDAAVAYTLNPGDAFTAESGYVQVTGPAIVAVMDTVRARPGVTFLPGDTVVVLDYIGEGYWNLWHRGREVREVEGFWGAEVQNPAGAYYGDYAREWWVHVTTPRDGWFLADSARFSGADACGAPSP